MNVTFVVNTRAPCQIDTVNKFLSKVKLFYLMMSDVQSEVPANEVGGIKEQLENLNQIKDDAIELKTEGDVGKVENEPAERKWKGKYDGRSKKRKWQFNRRDDNVKRERNEDEERVKRRKFLLVIGYAGANYTGMQRNPGVNTIEEELLKALFKNKLITEQSFEQPQYAHFQRSARTDKGVSAARQCVSLKLPEQVDLDSLNRDLPSDIKVFGIKRVTKGFNCKDQCNARTYSYTLPTISFAAHGQTVDMTTYRIDADILARVNETLKLFEGTQNFHNFTSRKRFDDPSAKRFIISFQSQSPFMVDDVEFCTIIVKGQSFMMHQIRKMIGLTIAVVRGVTTVDTISRSFEKTRIDIPMAPGLGLVLDQAHYDRYNDRFRGDGIHDLLEWDTFEDAIKEFRDKHIYPVIKDTEMKEQPMIKWLQTLSLHSYDEQPEGMAKNSVDNEEVDDENSNPAAEIDDE